MEEKKKILNKEQLEAIKHGKGPLLIIAGAGTGKTTVITERIKYLITSGLAKAGEILALTFTEKAALEMEERVDKIMPWGYFQMKITTFHTFGSEVLRDEAFHLGLNPHFRLMTEAESLMFLKKHLFEFKLDYFSPASYPEKFLQGLLEHFSRLKDEDISVRQYLNWARKRREEIKKIKNKEEKKVEEIEIKKNLELVQAYEKYEEIKIREEVMDFSDLISKTLLLFRKRKNVLKEYQKKFKYFLVDEFQDTNVSQNRLIQLLAGKEANLTVVADDDQSIYKWRGAAIANVLEFKKNFPQAKVITLTKNYRSTQEILNRAYLLIQHNNPDRLEVKEKINKKLISIRKEKGEKIKTIFTDRGENEADLVAEEIKRLVRPAKNKKNYQYKDIAILVRANNHADNFVRSFLRLGIPFQFLGPGRLFKQEEIKDLIAYLKVLDNFEDDIAFFRVLNLPIFQLSARDVAALKNYSRKYNLSLFEAAEKVKEIRVSEESKKKIEKIIEMIHKHLKLISKQTAGQILYYFLEDSGLIKKLGEVKSEKEEQQVNNIAKFFDKLKAYEAEHEDASVQAVVEWLNLKMEMGESPTAADWDWTEENKVNILTVHSAKGLEFPVVFLVNLVNERFPSRFRSEQIPIPSSLIKETNYPKDYHQQEERRLFYVAMTRTRDKLYFSGSLYYQEAKRAKKISPFVFEALGENFKIEIIKPFSLPKESLKTFSFLENKILSEKVYLPKKIDFLSYSQLETYIRCPMQYKYQYVLKIPSLQTAAASFGLSLHQTLKDFYQLKKKGKKELNLKDILELLEKNWQNIGYNCKSHEKRMYTLAKKYLSDFFWKSYKKEEKPLALEQSFIAKITPQLKLTGRFDRVDRLENGYLEIIDYKTGKEKTQKEADKDLQMTIYALAATDKGCYQQEPHKLILSFYFFSSQKKVSTRRTEKEIKKAKEEILSWTRKIEEGDFSPLPGKNCDFCPYKLLCPVW